MCDPLAMTGGTSDLAGLLLIGGACLVLGLLVLLASRASSRRRALLTGTAILVLAVALVAPTGGSAQAASSTCSSTAENSLTVAQTSTMEGLAPGIAPVAITGTVTNDGADSTTVFVVVVEIRSITRASGAAPGSCDPSDYVVVGSRMTVNRTLAPHGGMTTFHGASIGFAESSRNQDACKLATVHLHYTANPA